MPISVRSFAKINLGLRIGPRRSDGFHDLLTLYQTIDWHDVIHLELLPAAGIAIECPDCRVPSDAGNTCWRVAERVLAVLAPAKGVRIRIEKHLPVQGGLGAASSNAIATMFGIEKLLGANLTGEQRQQIAAGVGSDLPLFLHGGTVLGHGRGEVVHPVPDLPFTTLVVVAPQVSVSTPQAFADWDRLMESGVGGGIFPPEAVSTTEEEWGLPSPELTSPEVLVRIKAFRHALMRWLEVEGIASGVPALKKEVGGDRVEGSPGWALTLLGLVRTGIENDFERVVFPQYPELSELKRVLYEEGAQFASLSGSGSALYGIFESDLIASRALGKLSRQESWARVSRFVGREEYLRSLVIE